MQKHRISQRNKGDWLFIAGCVLIATGGVVVYSDAEAIPAFARKYNISCNVCHTRQPRLNSFGERFLENGYQLPGTSDGGTTAKRQLGGPLENARLDNIGNYMAVRLRGDIQKASFRKPDATETSTNLDIVLPNVANIFIAGTAAEDISFFMEAKYATREGHGAALGFERVFMVFDNLGRQQLANVKIGVFDPSSLYSFPTRRQHLNPIPPEAQTNGFPAVTNRIALLPLAFSSKMFGLTRGSSFDKSKIFTDSSTDTVEIESFNDNFAILPFEPFLYNAPFQTGLSVHGRPFGANFLYQVGLAQNQTAEAKPKTRWDTYIMLRLDLLKGEYSAFQVSGFYYTAPKAAMPTLNIGGTLVYADQAVDWKRYGIAARWTKKWWDVYGTIVLDEIDKPMFTGPMGGASTWDTSAMGISIEADYLYSSKWLFGVRYDMMDAGGLEKETPGWDQPMKQNAAFIGLMAKHYLASNIGLYVRYHQNLEGAAKLPAALGGEEHPATNLSSMALAGVDMSF